MRACARARVCVCARACVCAESSVKVVWLPQSTLPSPLFDVELELPVYQVRLDWFPLPCIALI